MQQTRHRRNVRAPRLGNRSAGGTRPPRVLICWRYRRVVAEVEDGGPDLQVEVLGRLLDFWDGRDVAHLHHPVWFRQFGDSALAVRGPDGTLAGYLLGCLTPRVAYVHVVAVQPSLRGTGAARSMYEVVLARAAHLGCLTVEAITTPGNTASLAFHRRASASRPRRSATTPARRRTACCSYARCTARNSGRRPGVVVCLAPCSSWTTR
jgi:GNAT superfamily N-acetyltransferase